METTSRMSDADDPAGLRLIRPALARMAAALRGAAGAAAVISALVEVARPVSWWWLAPALAVVIGWTPVYAMVAWTAGLRTWLIGVDLLLMIGLCLAVGKLVPAQALPGTVNWVTTLASMTVVTAQLAGRPAVSVPAGLAVAASVLAGSQLAHASDGGIPVCTVVATQVVAGAAVMAVAVRIERSAVRAFTALRETQAAAVVATARRAADLAQLRLVHNGPLSMLTMAWHACAGRPGEVLRRRAAATLAALPALDALPAGAGEPVPGVPGGTARLDEQLAQVVTWYEPPLTVIADLAACSVPAEVAEAFTGAAMEALENTVRYAATERAWLELREQDRVVRVTITDRGRGFDPARLTGASFGLREALAGKMAAAGGAAVIRTAPGAGTRVRLEWSRA